MLCTCTLTLSTIALFDVTPTSSSVRRSLRTYLAQNNLSHPEMRLLFFVIFSGKTSTQSHHSATAQPQTLCRMSEGDVTVLPFNLSRQESRTLTRLYSMNGGYHLRILPDGTVSGGRQENDPYDILSLKAVSVGVVVIKGESTGRYLAMNKKGRLYGSQALTDECYFLEKYEENHYNTYRSQKYNWYVGLKRNGQAKAGPDTHQGQKAVFFLPRPAGSV